MRSVLLVEAEIPLMQRMAWILLEAGFVTARVSHANDVPKTLGTYDPDIVVLNNDLPATTKRDCIDVMRNIKPQLRVLDVHSAGHDRTDAHGSGADDFLHMPFDAEDFVGKVTALIA